MFAKIACLALLSVPSFSQAVDLPPPTPLQEIAWAIADFNLDDDVVTPDDVRRNVENRFLDDVIAGANLPGHISRAQMRSFLDGISFPLPSLYLNVQAAPLGTDVVLHHTLYIFEPTPKYPANWFVQLGTPSGPQLGQWDIAKETDCFLLVELRGLAFNSTPTYDLARPLDRFSAPYSCSRGVIGDATFCVAD